MKKIVISIALLGILTGCSCSKSLTKETPTEVVEAYFSNYQSLSDDVLTQLDTAIDKDSLTDAQKDDYRDLMKDHYKNLKYEIKDEIIDGDTATVTTEVTVKDYSKVTQDAETYLSEHKTEFNDAEGNYDESLYNDYRIKKLKEVEDTATYTLELTLSKINDKWELDTITDDDESKIQGTYIK